MSSTEDEDGDSAQYQEEMDEMRCILYAHGGEGVALYIYLQTSRLITFVGGYYFGSVDQERCAGISLRTVQLSTFPFF